MSTNPDSQTMIDWAAIFRAAPVALCVASLADGTILNCNERYTQLTGISHDELIGRLAADLHVVADAAAREQIAAALDEDAAVYEVASQLRLPDGSRRESLSSLRVVEFAGEPAIISVTVENEAAAAVAAARAEAKSLREQLQRMEREIARHNEREQRLISQISGLCDQAGMLKSDVMRLKSLQQELSSEMEGLKQYGERYRSEAQTESASTTTAEVAPFESAKPLAAVEETLTAQIAARLSAFEDQLQKHVAALRAQSASLKSNFG